MKAKETNFLVRCANLYCEELLHSHASLKEVEKKFKCPKCGKINELHFLKAVYRIKKDQDQKIRCVNYSG